jgi:hypothetical protein
VRDGVLCTYIFVFSCGDGPETTNSVSPVIQNAICGAGKGPGSDDRHRPQAKASRQKTTRALELPALSANQSLPRRLNKLALQQSSG